MSDPPSELFTPRLSPRNAVIAAVLGFVAYACMGLFVVIPCAQLAFRIGLPDIAVYLSQPIMDVLCNVVVYLGVAATVPTLVPPLAARLRDNPNPFGKGLACGVAMVLVCLTILIVTHRFGWPASVWRPGVIVPDFVGDLTGILGQELVFTGIVTVILTKALPLRLALPTGAVMFSVSHLIGAGWVGATIVDTVVTQLHLMAMYVVFAIVFVRSGSIWLSFGLHLGWDLTNDIVFGDGAMAEPAVHAYLVNMRAWDDVMGAVWAIAVVVCLVALRANYLAVRQQGGGSAAADPANTTAAQPTTPEAP